MSMIVTKTIRELEGISFCIPDYQRGYRWERRQVKELVEDLLRHFSSRPDVPYCLQPLVVSRDKESAERTLERIRRSSSLADARKALMGVDGSWDVVDGQQRLTTLAILLACLGKRQFFSLSYATRPHSSDFLNDLDSKSRNEAEENIDYLHMWEARQTVENALKSSDGFNEDAFRANVLDLVQFIWYETDEPDPISVFTRLNIGKIALTNAELVKSLLLNGSNFANGRESGRASMSPIRLRQQEIALQWDETEHRLRDEPFWRFLCGNECEYSTRIEFLLDLAVDRNLLKLDKEMGELGEDNYRTFRYFESFFRRNAQNEPDALEDAWECLYRMFRIFVQWYDDPSLFHYVGFLVSIHGNPKRLLSELLNGWDRSETRDGFLKKDVLPLVNRQLDKLRRIAREKGLRSILDIEYGGDNQPSKTECRPLLLLHNVESVIRTCRNRSTRMNGNEAGDFPRFPFHLFLSEHWDVEHVDSSTENTLEEFKDMADWILSSLCSLSCSSMVRDDSDLRGKIEAFFRNEQSQEFESIRLKLDRASRSEQGLETEQSIADGLQENEKNQIWNFALLESSTNRGYGNAIFPAKRRILVGKERGVRIGTPKWEKDGLVFPEDELASSPFLPPCTKAVFLKCHASTPTDPRRWTREDAKAYRNDIESVLSSFALSL